MNRYLTFQCSQHPVPTSEEDEANCSGSSLAESIAAAIVAAGATEHSKNPVFGEGGWTFRFDFGSSRVNFFLNVADLTSLEEESWCLALIPRSKGLFKKSTTVPEQLIQIAETALAKLGASELRWWTADEFESEV